MPSRGRWCGTGRTTAPSSRRRPDRARVKPQMTLNSVVLPAPLGPMTPTIAPRGTQNETASSAVIPPKRTVTASTSSRIDGDALWVPEFMHTQCMFFPPFVNGSVPVCPY